MIDYGKRFVEVDEVLKHLSISDYNKIPLDLIKLIKSKKLNNYSWKYDESKELKKQGLHRDTIAILSFICSEYLLNEKQKEFVK